MHRQNLCLLFEALRAACFYVVRCIATFLVDRKVVESNLGPRYQASLRRNLSHAVACIWDNLQHLVKIPEMGALLTHLEVLSDLWLTHVCPDNFAGSNIACGSAMGAAYSRQSIHLGNALPRLQAMLGLLSFNSRFLERQANIRFPPRLPPSAAKSTACMWHYPALEASTTR
jgi:hypothetical protein